MNTDDVQAHIDAAGEGGRLVVQFTDRQTPVLDEKGEAVKDPQGNTVHQHSDLGHVRTVAAHVVAFIGTHLGLGHSAKGPIEHLIPLEDIHKIQPDPAEPAPTTAELAPELATGEAMATPAALVSDAEIPQTVQISVPDPAAENMPT